MNLAEKARVFAAAAHAGQVDKQGRDYFEHHLVPVAKVARVLASNTGRQVRVAALAYLHDVGEDNPVAAAQLGVAGLGELADAVGELTRSPDGSYRDYIAVLARDGTLDAVIVKLADNLVNASSLSSLDTATAQRLGQKYDQARTVLMDRFIRSLG